MSFRNDRSTGAGEVAVTTSDRGGSCCILKLVLYDGDIRVAMA